MKQNTLHNLRMLGAMIVVSGLTAAGTYKMMQTQADHTAWAQPGIEAQLTPVGLYSVGSSASVTDNDFTRAAESTVNAVVGITNMQSRNGGRKYYKGGDGYGGYDKTDPFFEFFFGQRGQRQQAPQNEEPTPAGSGSGVILSSDGYIVTNNHVIDKADQITVTLNDRRQFTATLVGTDPNTDIALLKIEATDLPTIPIGQSDALKVGEWVLAVGNPFNLTSTVTAGIVSAKGRSLGTGNNRLGIESFIQTDAAVNPGNSGGALVNTAGELVGINTAIYSQTGNYAGYSFAVPSSIVSKVVTDLKQYGTVQRALLGIMGGDLNAQVVDEKHLSVNEGVFVSEVSVGGAAAEAGIQADDVITAVNGHAVRSMADLQEQIARFRPGDRVQVTVNRRGDTRHFTCTLRNTQGSTDVVQQRGFAELGCTLRNLSAQELYKYGVRSGVQIETLDRNGLFYRSGLREKMVIIKVNDRPVSDARDIETLCEELTNHRSADQDPVLFIAAITPQGRVSYFAVDLSK